MERKSRKLRTKYEMLHHMTKREIKRLLALNNNKIMFRDGNDMPIMGISRCTGEIDAVLCSGVELREGFVKVILNTNEYLDGEPLPCDWIFILEEIENTLDEVA